MAVADVHKSTTTKTYNREMTRIGIFAGVFDPVHAGHIGFALRAIQDADLDEVYFMPERMPRQSPGTEHYGHRVAMIRRALEPHASLGLLELVDKQFSVNRTLPQLMKIFPDTEIVMLMGAEAFSDIVEWVNVSRLTNSVRFMVGVRDQDELQAITTTIAALSMPPTRVTIIDNDRPSVSSSGIRHALRQNLGVAGLLPSVSRYAKREWLYVTVPHAKSS